MAEAHPSWFQVARRRLGSQLPQTCAFAAIGAIIGELRELPLWLERAALHDGQWLMIKLVREMSSVYLAALVMMLALRLATDNGSDLIRRPRRFLLLLLLGSSLATALAWTVYASWHDGPGASPFPLDGSKVFDFWLQVLLWGGLIGWLYLLNLQRATDQLILASLQGRRALLSRQLAQARLGRARADIDPAMVARMLSVVHARYPGAPGEAAALLDQLISYLRLAMNRRQGDPAAPDDELAALRARLEKDMPCEQAPHAP